MIDKLITKKSKEIARSKKYCIYLSKRERSLSNKYII